MAVHKVLLFYGFSPLSDPDAVRLWQRDLCELLGLGGRIIVSPHGINGTVGGELSAVKKYWRKTREYPAFKHIDFKWSEGDGTEFPRLSVKVRPELVGFGVPDQVTVDENGVVGGGVHLKPEELHDLVSRKDVVFFDGRNKWEAEVGRFKNAVVPDVDTSHDFVRELDSGKYDHLKDQAIVTYCTGGIRCEILSSLMLQRGFTEVYQMDGGIVRYGETYGDAGLWEGSLVVFDNRKAITFSSEAAVLSHCTRCGVPSSRLENCAEPSCRVQRVVCDACAEGIVACVEHEAVLA